MVALVEPPFLCKKLDYLALNTMLPITPETKWQIGLDCLMLPVMYMLQGNMSDVPQRTHFWNYTRVPEKELELKLNTNSLLTLPGEDVASQRWLWWLPLLHMPIFGGWRHYYVLEPEEKVSDYWFVGWVVGEYSGISHVKLERQVRVLKGDTEASFFGFNSEGKQIKIRLIGEGSLGESPEYCKIPLL